MTKRDEKVTNVISILLDRKDSENRNIATKQEKIDALATLEVIHLRDVERKKQKKEDERQEILTYLTGLINRVEAYSIVDWESVTYDIEKHLTLPLDVGGLEE